MTSNNPGPLPCSMRKKLAESNLSAILDSSHMWLDCPGEEDRTWWNRFLTSGELGKLSDSPLEKTNLLESAERDKHEIGALINRIIELAISHRRKIAMTAPIHRLPPEIISQVLSNVIPTGRELENPEGSHQYEHQKHFIYPGFPHCRIFSSGVPEPSHPAMSVCKQWRSIMSRSPFQCRIVLDVDRTGHVRWERKDGYLNTQLSRFLEACPSSMLLEIEINTSWETLSPSIRDPEKPPLSLINRNLHRCCAITSSYAGPEWFDTLFSLPVARFANLQELEVRYTRMSTAESIDWEHDKVATVEFPMLHHISISGDRFFARIFYIHAPKLVALAATSMFPAVSPSRVSQLLAKSFPNLRYLDTWRLGLPGPIGNRDIPSLEIKSLEKLFVTLCALDLKTGILPLLDGCPNLRVIHICNYREGKGCEGSTPLRLPTSSVEEFWYSSKSQFLPPQIFESMPSLRFFHLTDMKADGPAINIQARRQGNSEALSGLLRNENTGTLPCPRLEKLILDQVPLRTDILFRIFAQRNELAASEQNYPGNSHLAPLKFTWKGARKGLSEIEGMTYEQLPEYADILAEYDKEDSFMFVARGYNDEADVEQWDGAASRYQNEEGSQSNDEESDLEVDYAPP